MDSLSLKFFSPEIAGKNFSPNWNYSLQKGTRVSVERAPDATSQPSDLSLAQSAAKGDSDAFHELIDRHAKRLFRIALSLSSTRDDAEDVVQETLIGAFQSIQRFDGRSSVKTWLTGILLRQAAKGWHRGRHSRSNLSIDANDQAGNERPEAATIASPADASDRQMDFATALEGLSPLHRQIVVLREIEQLSYEEIAEALKIPRGTVESRLHRARIELRERLGAYAGK